MVQKNHTNLTVFDRVISRIILCCGIFMLFGYVLYAIKLIIYPEGWLPPVACAGVILVLGAYFLFGKRLPQVPWCRILKTFFAAGLAFYVISFFVMIGVIVAARQTCISPSDAPNDCVVWVFGAKIQDDEPGNVLRRRLDTATLILQDRPDALCIVSGGQGSDEAYTEASVMRAYLEQQGIDSTRVIMEERATDTEENTAYCMALTEQYHLQSRPIVCVSTDFHIPRIRMLLAREGYHADYCASGSRDVFTYYTSLVREYMSYVKQFLQWTF